VSIICLVSLVKLRKEQAAREESITEVNAIVDTSETKMADELIGHTDNDTYISATPSNILVTPNNSLAAYEEI